MSKRASGKPIAISAANSANASESTYSVGETNTAGRVLENSSGSFGGYLSRWLAAWDVFWFTPARPETLASIRILTGAMLTYVHVIWLSQIQSFMGSGAWINLETIRMLHQDKWSWSWLHWIDSPALLILHQVVAILASLAMTFGAATRISTVLAWWLTLMVCHRMTGALFGLDQTVMMLTMYLMWSNCGSCWSIDAKIAQRKGGNWLFPLAQPTINNNVVTRLIQLHLCIIYLFGGLSKLRGEMWWDGSAMWFSIVNYEYQSLNLTWLGHFPFVISLITTVTVLWETFYIALVWPKLTRPVVLAMAVFVHGGICVGLGMWTFGAIMIVANISFLRPDLVSGWMGKFAPRLV